jgi:hypothetical protein
MHENEPNNTASLSLNDSMEYLNSYYVNPLLIRTRTFLPVVRLIFLSALAQCCFIVSTPAQEASAAPKPMYPVTAHAPMFQLQGHRPAFELLGIDLAQDDAPVGGDIPKIEAGTPVDITFHLRPTSERIADRKIRVNIRPLGVGPAPGYSGLFDIDLGDWEYRVLTQKTYRLALPVRNFVGRGMLRISEVDPADEDWRRAATLWTMQVDVPAHAWRSTVNAPRIAAAFGPHAKRLHAAFRLGPGTRVVVPVEAVDYPIAAVGLLTNVSWHSELSPGASICRVILNEDATNDPEALEVVYGATTFKGVVSLADSNPDTIDAPIAWTSPVPGNGDIKKERRIYSSILSVTEVVSPNEIVFGYQGDAGMLDVYEVVLLPQR